MHLVVKLNLAPLQHSSQHCCYQNQYTFLQVYDRYSFSHTIEIVWIESVGQLCFFADVCFLFILFSIEPKVLSI